MVVFTQEQVEEEGKLCMTRLFSIRSGSNLINNIFSLGWETDINNHAYTYESNKSAALRLDVPNSSDAIKGSMGFSEGFHIFQINWRVENRDNNSVVGIGTENAILHADGSNVPLIGVDAESYGWNIGTGKLANSFVKDRIFPSWYYEDEDTYRAPYVFYCLLNLDIGYMAFVDNDYFLGFAAVGLSGKTWYPLATTGFPTAHVGITYLGGKPESLLDCCILAFKKDEEYAKTVNTTKLPLPQFIKKQLLEH